MDCWEIELFLVCSIAVIMVSSVAVFHTLFCQVLLGNINDTIQFFLVGGGNCKNLPFLILVTHIGTEMTHKLVIPLQGINFIGRSEVVIFFRVALLNIT